MEPSPQRRSPHWAIVVLVLSVTALTSAGVMYTVSEKHHIVSAHLYAATVHKAQSIENWLNRQRHDAEVLRGTHVFSAMYQRWRESGDAAAGGDLFDLLRAYVDHYGYQDILLVDTSSGQAWNQRGEPAVVDSALQQAIARDRDEGQATLTGPHLSADGGHFIEFLAPLRDASRAPAMIVLRMDLYRFLEPLLAETSTPLASIETLLFRRDAGEVQFLHNLWRAPDDPERRRSLATDGLLAAQIINDKGLLGQVIEGVDYLGVPVIGIALPVPGTDWFLLNKADRAEFYQQVLEEAFWILLVGLLSLVAGVVGLNVLFRRQAVALAAQNQRHSELLRHMSAMTQVGGWEFNAADGQGSWTEEVARIHEVPPEQPTSVEFGLQFYAGESRRRIQAAIDKAIHEGKPYDLELELRSATGEHKWVRTIGVPVMDAEKVTLVRGAIQDITARKQMELALRHERGLLKTLIQTLPDLVWLKDVNGVYLACNRRFSEFIGAAEHDVIGKNDYDYFDRELADFFRAKDAAAIAAGQACVNEEEVPFADGHLELLETTKTPMFDEDGRLIGVLGIGRNITGLHQAQEALRLERDRAQRFLATVQSIMVAVDTQGRITMINKAGCNLLGYAEQELLGRNWFDTCLPQPAGSAEVYPVFLKILAGGAAGKALKHYENAVRCRDGTERLIAWHNAPIVDDHDTVIGVLGSGEDVTERRAAERALRESEAQTRLLLESTAGAIYGVDRQGRFTWVNPACVKMLGYERDTELLGRESHPLMHHSHADGSNYPACECRVYHASRSDQGVHVDDEVFWRRDGTAIAVEYWAYPIHQHGKVVGTVVAWLDISERRATEAQLRKLSLAVEQSIESIVITDADGNIEYVNNAFVKTTGYSLEEVIGRNPRILQSGKTPKKTFQAMWAAISHGRPWKGTLYNRRRDGTEYVELAVLSPIRGADGRITHYVAAKEDITEKQRVAEELNQYRNHLEELVQERTTELADARQRADAANEAKSAFLANMSHEIRTPMNGVVGLLDVLENSGLSVRQAGLVDTIRQSAATLLAIIDDVLDLSKIEAGRMELEKRPVSLAELVESVCGSLAASASQRDVELYVFVDPAMPSGVLTDALRLRQVLYNLIGNAIKFSSGQADRQARVWVSAEVLEREPLSVRFHVDDNGIGMAPERSQHLFDAFTQAEASTTRRFGGTGLGLTICKRVVDLLHGEITIDSQLGEGARFSVTVPLEYTDRQPVADSTDLSGIHCVLVENDARDAEWTATYLRHAGARVTPVPPGGCVPLDLHGEAGPTVVICTESSLLTDVSCDNTRIPADLPVLFIKRGAHRQTHAERANLVMLEGNVLRRSDLSHGVASAVGIAPVAAPAADDGTLHNVKARAPSITEARAQGRLILVAEDDAVNQMVVLEQLDILGYAAEVANNGAEALDLWRDGGYALLLTDLHMPLMDGYQLAAAIRREETGDRLPIVALTANALRGEDQRVLSAQMDGYLTKPVQLVRLKNEVQRWLPTQLSEPAVTDAATSERPASPPAGDQLVNPETLRELVGDDPAIIRQLLQSYLDASRGYADELQTANTADDITVVGAIAHKLKSASRAVGALSLGDLCADLENAAKSGDMQDVQAKVPEFMATFDAVDKALEQLVQQD